MFETTSSLSSVPTPSQTPALQSESLSLPNIPKKPASRGSPPSKKQLTHKQKLILPSLYYTEEDGLGLGAGERDKENMEIQSKTAFAKEVKDRLNLVLGEMPYVENANLEEDEDSDDMDFQEKINQNKEIIKMHKLKKETERNESQRLKNSNEDKPKKPKKNRNQSLYEKRLKQYREQSLQNKYLQKRKQTVKQQHHQNLVAEEYHAQQSMKDIKSKDQYNNNNVKGGKHSAMKSGQKRAPQRVLSQRSSHRNLVEPVHLQKNDNLFDSIQNYLENPHENKKQNGAKQLVGLTLLKAKRDIEDKIKAINQKLGVAQNQQQKTAIAMPEIDASVRDWRRIEIGLKRIDYQTSNFDKEIERIGTLQERNSLYLQKYLEQQKMLLDLELRKNQQVGVKNVNSH